MEQKITDVVRQNREVLIRPTASETSSLALTIDSLNAAVYQKYGQTGMEILNKYNSDFIFRKQLTERDCIIGDYPTIAELNKEYDKRFGPAWLMAHLHDLSEFCGCSKKLTGHALQQCASTISMEYYYLKVSEVMLFFHRFKSGRYGQFYGSVDPLVITSALNEFVKERNIVLSRYKQEEKIEEKVHCVSWEEFCKMNGRDPKKHPLASLKTEAPATTKPKEQKRNSEDYTKSIAYSLINNSYRCNPDNLKMMKDMFKQKYGCTPEEYVSPNYKEQ